MIVWFIYAGLLLYMELVFHLSFFGFAGTSPLPILGWIMVIASVQTLISGSLPEKKGRWAFWIFTALDFLLFSAQSIYYHIFAQPLLLKAALLGGEDALTNYWREALTGLVQVSPRLLLLFLPIIVLIVLWAKKIWRTTVLDSLKLMRTVLLLAAGICLFVCSIFIGKSLKADYAEEYLAYYDSETVLVKMGVMTLSQRDLLNEFARLTGKDLQGGTDEDDDFSGNGMFGNQNSFSDPFVGISPVASAESSDAPGSEASGEESGEVTDPSEEIPPEPVINTDPYIFNLDYDKMTLMSDGKKETKWLAQYFSSVAPTTRNAYTGMFTGYNLIYLTAEGFSTYCISEELTPTLYKLSHSGFVFNNYYVPIWATSTSDGEFVNCTGLIPDGQFSMRNSADNNMLYTLPRYFASEGVYSRAYHNNSLSYYDRYLSHPNLGYDFNAIKLGGLSQAEWGSHIFEVETPNAWPGSDLEMIQSTVQQYVNEDRFHVYYMTVSGHMNYNFKGNRMSSKNKDAVAGLDMSENARAYIACQIELDKALADLIEQLEAAGKLENTVICLSADHYPYGMTEEQYEELAGKDLSHNLDLYRNTLILWNAGMEEPVIVDKVGCSVDILPTLLNLFGFDYDSRLYAGRDLFSDGEGVVIMKDQSFVTDTVAYDKKTKETTWKRELTAEEQEAYLNAAKQEVKNRYLFSAYIMRNDYYTTFKDCIIGQ